mmetsp:Transcript_50970/g.75628  ORF Transcript_50970/g.75628 Transcript_50970/m.75628 type:complete len:250 (-) Transcript_50970:489-1238(-)
MSTAFASNALRSATTIIPHRHIHSEIIPPPLTVPRLILLDRDGVINEDVGAPGVVDPNQLRLTSGAGRAIGRLRRRGCQVALITNQSCVGKKLITEAYLMEIHNHLKQLLIEEDIDAMFDRMYICPSRKEDNDPRMKPGSGMVLEALADFEINGEECVFIGDTATDMMAAKAGGVGLRMLTETGYGRGLMGGNYGAPISPVRINRIDYASNNDQAVLNGVVPFVYATNLAGAVEWLLRDGNDNGIPDPI